MKRINSASQSLQIKKLRQQAVHPQQWFEPRRINQTDSSTAKPNRAVQTADNTPSLSLKHTSLFPSVGPAFFPQSLLYVHMYTLHMWGKYLAKWLAAVKQRGPSEGGDSAGLKNTGLRRSWGSRYRYMGQLCQVERSSLVFPRATESAECEGIKTSPGLFALFIDSELRLSQCTDVNNRQPIQPSCWDHLSTTGTSFNLARKKNTPSKTAGWLCPAHFLSRLGKLDQTGFFDRFQRSLSKSFSSEIINSFRFI